MRAVVTEPFSGRYMVRVAHGHNVAVAPGSTHCCYRYKYHAETLDLTLGEEGPCSAGQRPSTLCGDTYPVPIARTPGDQPFPIRHPAACGASRRSSAIPRVLYQTGRGNSLREHNNMSDADVAAHAKMTAGMQVVFQNDETARAFVARECPYALRVYDCLIPVSYRADLWRYCALWTRGGYYLDAEDRLLVPLLSLARPCDTLMLVRDRCPSPSLVTRSREHSTLYFRHNGSVCRAQGVQVSLLAAAPRHPFFRCALALLMRNVHRRLPGRTALELTGPSLAGACLDYLHRRFRPKVLGNHSMDLWCVRAWRACMHDVCVCVMCMVCMMCA